MIDGVTLLGLAAGTLTTISFFPQLLHTWKSKSAKDISLGMYIAFCSGILLWLIYGLLIDSVPVIAANAVTLVIALSILVLKIRFR
jgi:MtN3 and saliva related transmembrane protein